MLTALTGLGFCLYQWKLEHMNVIFTGIGSVVARDKKKLCEEFI